MKRENLLQLLMSLGLLAGCSRPAAEQSSSDDMGRPTAQKQIVTQNTHGYSSLNVAEILNELDNCRNVHRVDEILTSIVSENRSQAFYDRLFEGWRIHGCVYDFALVRLLCTNPATLELVETKEYSRAKGKLDVADFEKKLTHAALAVAVRDPKFLRSIFWYRCWDGSQPSLQFMVEWAPITHDRSLRGYHGGSAEVSSSDSIFSLFEFGGFPCFENLVRLGRTMQTPNVESLTAGLPEIICTFVSIVNASSSL